MSSSAAESRKPTRTDGPPAETVIKKKKKKSSKAKEVSSAKVPPAVSTHEENQPPGGCEDSSQHAMPPSELPRVESPALVHDNEPGMEESRNWEQHGVSPVNVLPRYEIDEGDEFRNVWGGGGEQSGQPGGGAPVM